MKVSGMESDSRAEFIKVEWNSSENIKEYNAIGYEGVAVQVSGEFGGTSVILMGSLGGSEDHPVVDKFNEDVEFVAEGIKWLDGYMPRIRPYMAEPTEATDLTVTVILRKV